MSILARSAGRMRDPVYRNQRCTIGSRYRLDTYAACHATAANGSAAAVGHHAPGDRTDGTRRPDA